MFMSSMAWKRAYANCGLLASNCRACSGCVAINVYHSDQPSSITRTVKAYLHPRHYVLHLPRTDRRQSLTDRVRRFLPRDILAWGKELEVHPSDGGSERLISLGLTQLRRWTVIPVSSPSVSSRTTAATPTRPIAAPSRSGLVGGRFDAEIAAVDGDILEVPDGGEGGRFVWAVAIGKAERDERSPARSEVIGCQRGRGAGGWPSRECMGRMHVKTNVRLHDAV